MGGLTLIKSHLVPSKQSAVGHNQAPGVILFQQRMKIRWNGTSPYGGSSCATFHSSLTYINTGVHTPGQQHTHGQFPPCCSAFVTACTAEIFSGRETSPHVIGHSGAETQKEGWRFGDVGSTHLSVSSLLIGLESLICFPSLEMPSSTCGPIWKGKKTSSLMRANVASHSPSD